MVDWRMFIGQAEEAGLGMLAMPLGPFEKALQFSRTSRMISPKPRVTMAR